MKLSFTVFAIHVLLLQKYVTSSHVDVKSRTNSIQERNILCTLFSTHRMTLHDNPEIEPTEIKPTICCVMDNNKSISVINIPNDFFKLKKFVSGKMQLLVPTSSIKTQTSDLDSEYTLHHGVIDLTEESDFIVLQDNKIRKLSPKAQTSDLTLLVVRVTDNSGHSPKHTVKEISDHVFGTDNDDLNLVIGYKECSGGKISFTGNVVELSLDLNVANLAAEMVEDYVTEKLPSTKSSKYTNVMYVLPNEVKFNGSAAYAGLNHYLSVFKDYYVSFQFLLMHEIAHNLGHHHSGQGSFAYGDHSCMMGLQTYTTTAPRACFNGAKSWWFGWYSDRHTEITPTSQSSRLKMLSINDYLNGEATLDNQYTVARIVGQNEIDLYVMYNRAEGVNSGVRGYRDQVTIVHQNAESQASWLDAGLSEKGTSQWKKHNWSGTGNTLVIKVCNIVSGAPDYAHVIVYLDGVNYLSCPLGTPDQSSACPSGFSKLEVKVQTDNWGNEVGWWIKEKKTWGKYKGKYQTILRDNDLQSNALSTTVKCIDDSKSYKFKITDEGGNGTCWQYGRAWYSIRVEDVTKKISSFNSPIEVVTFKVS